MRLNDNLGRTTPSIPISATVCSPVALVSCLDNTALILRTYAAILRKEQDTRRNKSYILSLKSKNLSNLLKKKKPSHSFTVISLHGKQITVD